MLVDGVVCREQAVVHGQVLIDSKWITNTVTDDNQFRDDQTYYRLAEVIANILFVFLLFQ